MAGIARAARGMIVEMEPGMRPYLLASLLLPLAACADPNPEPDELATSRSAWEQARDEAADSYSYVRVASYWTGERMETTVIVEGGNIVERDYVAYDGTEEITDSWQEYGVDVGSHEAGFEALTIDQLYDLCRDDVMPSATDTNVLTFTTFEDGLLQNCFTVDQSLEDSGADGVALESIGLDPQTCGVRGVPCG